MLGSNRDTLLPKNDATHNFPSLSMHIPSGKAENMELKQKSSKISVYMYQAGKRPLVEAVSSRMDYGS